MDIRGLNAPLKQKEVRSFVMSNDLDFLCILETRVRVSNKDRIFNSLLPGWKLYHNYVHAMDQAMLYHVTDLKEK